MPLKEEAERRGVELALDERGLELQHPRQQVHREQLVEGLRLRRVLGEAERQDGQPAHHVGQLMRAARIWRP